MDAQDMNENGNVNNSNNQMNNQMNNQGNNQGHNSRKNFNKHFDNNNGGGGRNFGGNNDNQVRHVFIYSFIILKLKQSDKFSKTLRFIIRCFLNRMSRTKFDHFIFRNKTKQNNIEMKIIRDF